MNIYSHELKAKLPSMLTWSVSLAVLILVFMSLFSAFSADTAMVNELMKNFPPELLAAFGMTDLDWSTILGYFALIFVFCQICLAVQAANYGFSLVSIEETEWTADFLLAKPVGRPKIMTSKLLAALTGLATTNAVVWIASFVFIGIFSHDQAFDARSLVLLLLSMAVFQLFFLSVGMVISVMVKRIRSVTPYSMALVFGLYILNAFGDMFGQKSLEVLSPFNHFRPSYIIRHGAWDLPQASISVAIILISIAGSYLLYERRNIPSAV